MRNQLMIPLSVCLLMAATTAHASFGGGSNRDSAPPATSAPEATPSASKGARQEAEAWYNDAYNDVAKAKREQAEGKEKNAEKRYRKAVERAQHAVSIDSTYHEAWNLIGYGSRQLKQYDASLAAYQRCLRLKPDYAPAREYLAEAYLMMNQPEKAREQVAWLEKAGAAEELVRFKAAWDDWARLHPEQSASMSSAASAPTAPATASTDSTSVSSKP